MSISDVDVINRLRSLDNTQQSVELHAEWFLDNRSNAKDLVKLWFKEFRKALPKRKIAFLHLVNDIVQKGYITAPHYGKLFEPVLPTAFKETSKIQKHSVRASVAHLLIVWATRRIYPKSFLRQLRFICQRAVADSDAPDADEEVKKNIITASPFAFSFSSVMLNSSGQSVKEIPTPHLVADKSTIKKTTPTIETNVSFNPNSGGFGDVPCDSISAFREELARELQTEAAQPPTVGDLINTLESLQSAASADAATRREIAQFPPEVADFKKALESIQNASRTQQMDLVKHIKNCSNRLEEYNKLLEEEIDTRNQLGNQLKLFRCYLMDQLNETTANLKDVKVKLDYGGLLSSELKKHILNLPDLHLLPDKVMINLDPLPAVGDLFN